MTLIFSERPGRHERHLKRKLDNPLFPEAERTASPKQLLDVQKRDHDELVAFIGAFRALVQRAVHLQPTEESQVLLELKEALDRAYEQASALADDQTATKAAIAKLVGLMMNAVRAGAAGDPVALKELADEEAARAAHFRLLEQPLVADLLDPRSVIGQGELAATLLSEPEAAVAAALELFDATQLRLLQTEAAALLAELQGADVPAGDAANRLALIEQALAASGAGDVQGGDGA